MRKLTKTLLFATCFVVALSMSSVSVFAAKKVLRSTWAWPTYIDPAVGSDNSSASALVNLYDTLVFPDKSGNPMPHAAKSWKSSKDGKTWTFNLRKGIKFHNGAELTAKDVKFSMERMIAIGQGYAFLFAGKGITAEAAGKYTVVFKFKKAFGPFLTTLYRFSILNKDLVMRNLKKPGAHGKLGDYGKKFLLTNDAGSGPYKVKQFKFEEYLIMTKNADYFLPLDSDIADEIKMIGTTQAVTVRSMMSRGELEISDQWQAQESLKALKRIRGVKVANFYMGDLFYFMMHTKKAPTDDIHFRKAMSWAMDYQTVVKLLFPGSKQSRGPVAQTVPGANPYSFQYTKNLDKAKEELRKSKYWGKLDQYPVEIHWVAEVPDEEKVALLFMSNMSEIGINVKVVKVPWMSVVEETANMDTSPHIVTIFDNPKYPEAGSILEGRYTSGTAATWEQNEWLLDKKYDAKVSDALATINRQSRMRKYMALQDYIVDICPTIFMFDKVVQHAYNTNKIEWPAVNGETANINGFVFAARFIKFK